MKTLGLGGVIFRSSNPEKLANFYQQTFGLPFELNSHGGLAAHLECDYRFIHYAILKADKEADGNSVVPSFIVEDIEQFVKENELTLLNKILPLGNGSFVGQINDPDGHRVHLWMNKDIWAKATGQKEWT